MGYMNYEQIKTALSCRDSFQGNSASAVQQPHIADVGQGQLNEDEYAKFIEARNTGDMHYVVISYRTPIAWVTDGVPYVVEQHFSMTTLRLQNLCRTYL